jgi:adenylyltransferase/sulfurtransferase
MYLTAAGVGNITLVDDDKVDLTNLQRQIVHRTANIGKPKVESAAASLQQLNSATSLILVDKRLDATELSEQISNTDVVVDCTDNFTTRFTLNKLCVQHKKPLVSGAAIRLEGQLSIFDSRQPESPCYRCLYAEIDDENLSCAQSGVLSPVVGVIGTLQAVETIKLIVGFGESLAGRLQLYDAKQGTWREFKLNKDPNCPVCRAN